MALVEVSGLKKVFPGREKHGDFTAVAGVSFSIAGGETLGLVGESGCGKTTLGRMLLRLIEPTSGSITFDGQDLMTLSGSALRRRRRDLQIIFQDPFGSLDPRMRVRDVLTEPMVIHGEGGDHQAQAAALLKSVGLDDSALPRYPHEFSGGQRQRIVIARALALRPKFIVADEPVSALDVSVGAQIVNLLQRLQREFQLTYLFISHSMPVVRYLSNRIAVMKGGQIVEIGPTEQITTAPQHDYTRTLLAATPELSTRR